MLNIFSHDSWPSVCLLQKIVFGTFTCFQLDCLLFCYWVIWVLYFGYCFCKFLYIMICKYLFPFSRLPFLFCSWFPSLWGSFYVWCRLIGLFLLFLPLILGLDPKNYCLEWCQGAYCLHCPLWFLCVVISYWSL